MLLRARISFLATVRIDALVQKPKLAALKQRYAKHCQVANRRLNESRSPTCAGTRQGNSKMPSPTTTATFSALRPTMLKIVRGNS